MLVAEDVRSRLGAGEVGKPRRDRKGRADGAEGSSSLRSSLCGLKRRESGSVFSNTSCQALLVVSLLEFFAVLALALASIMATLTAFFPPYSTTFGSRLLTYARHELGRLSKSSR